MRIRNHIKVLDILLVDCLPADIARDGPKVSSTMIREFLKSKTERSE